MSLTIATRKEEDQGKVLKQSEEFHIFKNSKLIDLNTTPCLMALMHTSKNSV